MLKTGLWLPTHHQFSCFLEAILLLVEAGIISRWRVFRDKPLSEIVSSFQCPGSRNIVQLQQHAYILATLQNLLTLFSSESDSTSWMYCCHIIWSFMGFFVLLRRFCLRQEQLIDPSESQVLPNYLDGSQILHIQLPLLRRHWADWQKNNTINCINCGLHLQRSVSDSIPRPLLLRIPLDNGVVARKVGCPLSANSSNICSAILSQAPCGLFSKEYHFFSEPGPNNFHCPIPNFFASTLTTLVIAFSVEGDVLVSQIAQKIIDFTTEKPTLWILGRCSTRVQSTLHYSIIISAAFSRIGLLQFCSSKLRWNRDVEEPFRGTTQNLRRHRLLSAEDW